MSNGERKNPQAEAIARAVAEAAAKKGLGKKTEQPAPVEVAKEATPSPPQPTAEQLLTQEEIDALLGAVLDERKPSRAKADKEPSPAAEKVAPVVTGFGFEAEEPGKPAGPVETPPPFVETQEQKMVRVKGLMRIATNREGRLRFRINDLEQGENNPYFFDKWAVFNLNLFCTPDNIAWIQDKIKEVLGEDEKRLEFISVYPDERELVDHHSNRIRLALGGLNKAGWQKQIEKALLAFKAQFVAESVPPFVPPPPAARVPEEPVTETPEQKRARVRELMEEAEKDGHFIFVDKSKVDAWIADVDLEEFGVEENRKFIFTAISRELGDDRRRLMRIYFTHVGGDGFDVDDRGFYRITLDISDASWKEQLIKRLREVKAHIEAEKVPTPPPPRGGVIPTEAHVREVLPPGFRVGPAIWHGPDYNQLITIKEYGGIGTDGRHYVYVEESEGGIPLDEIKYNQTVEVEEEMIDLPEDAIVKDGDKKDPRLRFIPGPAIWHSADGDVAVTVVRYAGFDSNDRPYVFIQGRDTPIAVEEIEYPEPLPEEEGDILDKFVVQISSWWRKMKGKDQRGWMEEGKRLAAESASRFFAWLESGVKDRGRTYNVDRVEAPEEQKIKRARELIDHVESSDERLKFDVGGEAEGYSKWWDTIDLEKFCSDRNIVAIQQIVRFELGEDEECLEEIAFVTKDKKSSIDVAHGKIRIQVVFEEEWKEVLRQHLRGLFIGKLIEQTKEDEPRLQFGHEPAHEDKEEEDARHKEEHFDPLEWINIPAIPDLCKPDSLYEIRGMISGILGKYEEELKKIRLYSEARESYVNIKSDAHEGVIDLYINQPNQWKTDPDWWKNALRKGLQMFKTECEHTPEIRKKYSKT